jgi:hypothetical protein
MYGDYLMRMGVILSLIMSNGLQAEVRHANDVFAKWIDTKSLYFQRCIPDIKPIGMRAIKPISKLSKAMQPLKEPLLTLVGNEERSQLDARKLNFVQHQVVQSMPNFIQALKQAGLSSLSLNQLDERDSFNNVLNRYSGFFRTLFLGGRQNTIDREFAVANRFVEFCFGQKTFPLLQKILADDATRPVARFLYTAMWKNLAGQGWKYWHQDTLKRLRNAYENGKTINYIAGGSDVYQLLVHGVYNIKVIDPQLTNAQDNYYADQWKWLLKGKGSAGGQGDEMHFTALGKACLARRAEIKTGKTFKVVLDGGNEVRHTSAQVVWHIFEEGVRKGSLTFDRRLATQEDFEPEKNEELLMSFNELYFIALPEDQGGWPINPHALIKDFNMHVKQLRKPVTKKVVQNIAWVDENNLAFLRLGTAVK